MKTLLTIFISFYFMFNSPKSSEIYIPTEPLKVLTINILYNEILNKDERLQRIVDFVIDNDINIIFIQECTPGTPEILLSLLDEYNGFYDIENSFGNVILTNYPILQIDSFDLIQHQTEGLFSWQRKIVMAQIELPDKTKLNIFNTHLSAWNAFEREKQVEEVVEYIKKINYDYEANGFILGGDFNLIREREQVSYKLLSNIGKDTFLEAGIGNGDTFGLYGNPYILGPKRIDYIFCSFNLTTKESIVIFNKENDWVSDHSGLLTEF